MRTNPILVATLPASAMGGSLKTSGDQRRVSPAVALDASGTSADKADVYTAPNELTSTNRGAAF